MGLCGESKKVYSPNMTYTLPLVLIITQNGLSYVPNGLITSCKRPDPFEGEMPRVFQSAFALYPRTLAAYIRQRMEKKI